MAISADNASEIRELARYGEPVTFNVLLTRNGKRLIVHDSFGLSIYDRDKEEKIGQIDAVPRPPNYELNYFANEDGSRVAVFTLDDIRIFDDQNQLLGVIPYPQSETLGTIERRYQGDLAFSPDFSLAAFSYYWKERGVEDWDYGEIFQVWDVMKNELVFEDRGVSPVFLEDGRHLAIEFDSKIWLYDTDSWEKRKISTTRSGWGKVFSPDGKLFGLLQEEQTAFWNTHDGKLVRVFPHLKSIWPSDLVFSANGRFIAVRNPDDWNILDIWDIVDGTMVDRLEKESSWPMELLFVGNDGQVFVDGFAENKKAWFEVAEQSHLGFDDTGTALLSIDHRWVEQSGNGKEGRERITGACAYRFSRETVCTESKHTLFYDNQGELYSLARLENGGFELYQGVDEQGTLLATLRGGDNIGEPGPLFSADHRFLIYSTYGYSGSAIKVWDTVESRSLKDEADDIALSPDGRFLALIIPHLYGNTTVRGNYLWVYDLENKREVYLEEGYGLDWGYLEAGMAFSADSKNLVYANPAGFDYKNEMKTIEVRTLDLDTGQSAGIFTLDVPDIHDYLSSMTFSPDGSILAVGFKDGNIRFFDPKKGEQLSEWQAHQDGVARLAFSPDGKLLASASRDYNLGYDGFIKVWGIVP